MKNERETEEKETDRKKRQKKNITRAGASEDTREEN